MRRGVNMTEKLFQVIDDLVEEIYTIEQGKVNEKFGILLNELLIFIEDMQNAGYTIVMDDELLKLQKSYEMKDYGVMADILLYDIKENLENL